MSDLTIARICELCKWWEPDSQYSAQGLGICSSTAFGDHVLIVFADEVFWCADFGCRFWEAPDA